ncbi:MAG: 50S ribosomal protein L25 [Acidobacteria bacterium]|nr:50S ribosomal protein L25 [Acidobacteriota bacterium]
MAEKIKIKAEKRDNGGKNVNRRLRADGKIPVVIYGGGGESVAAIAELKDLAAILRTDAGINTVFSLDLPGESGDVIFQERQIDPVRGRLIHADLRRIAKGEKMEMTIPIHLVGEAEGLKEDGAVLSQAMREIKVLVEPAKAPESFDLDITELAVGHSLHVSDLKVGEGVEVHEEPETVIASVVIVKEEELEPQLETAEPEVVGEGPTEGGEGGGEPAE